MILYVNGSVRYPVFDCNSGKYYGRISDFLLDDNLEKVMGFVCRTRFARPRWAVEISAIQLANKDLLLINPKKKRWLPLNKKMNAAWKEAKSKRKINALEGDKVVGQVSDFAFDSETGLVAGIMVNRSLLGKLIYLPKSEILEFKADGFRIREGAIAEREPAKPEGGGLFDGLLKAAARGLGTSVAKARVGAKQLNAKAIEGKKAASEIRDKSGQVIVSEGETIDTEKVAKLLEADKASEASLTMMGKNFGAALAKAKKKLDKGALKKG